jgi:putative protease
VTTSADRPRWRIVAPVSSVDEAEQALRTGADELYCGALPDDWARDFGDDDLMTRRQGRAAHLTTEGQLREVAQLARAARRPIALTLNGRYTRDQMSRVLQLARLWEGVGGMAIIVADPVLVQALARDTPGVALHVSTLAGVFNPEAARLFADLGASRIILPRDLTITEMEALVAHGPPLEYEALALFQRCELIDGLCGFRHAVRLPNEAVACEFAYQRSSSGVIATSLDPEYEGHGCMLAYESDAGLVRHLDHADVTRPRCAACHMDRLSAAGVRYFKIAGRGIPSTWILRGVGFLREVRSGSSDAPDAYAHTWGTPCRRERCYYTEGERKGT